MFDIIQYGEETEKVNKMLKFTASISPSDLEFISKEIAEFEVSQKREWMITGEKYYDGDQDILKRQREVIGKNGELEVVNNLPNNRTVDNQYAFLVDQKTNYLFSNPIQIDCENEDAVNAIDAIFNSAEFGRKRKYLAERCFNCAIAYLHPYYDAEGKLKFKVFRSYNCLPFWQDEEHTKLDMFVRLYNVIVYEYGSKKLVRKAEIYQKEGIYRFNYEGGKLEADEEEPFRPYMKLVDEYTGETQPTDWGKIPIIPFKLNGKEIPLIKRVKSLQDALNLMISDFQNNLQEDARNTIMVVENYEGENLGEFRRNLAQYGAVSVTSTPECKGGVSTVTVKVDASNYEAILKILKKAIIENGRGYDAKSDAMTNDPNEMNIQSMYSEIDLDSNDMEKEFQCGFEELMYFINVHFRNMGMPDYEGENIKFLFNRNIMINESSVVENCKNSYGVISRESIYKKHPFVFNSAKEEEAIRRERIEDLEYEIERAKRLAELKTDTTTAKQQLGHEE